MASILEGATQPRPEPVGFSPNSIYARHFLPLGVSLEQAEALGMLTAQFMAEQAGVPVGDLLKLLELVPAVGKRYGELMVIAAQELAAEIAAARGCRVNEQQKGKHDAKS